MKKPKVVSVLNFKGGVCKSTVASALLSYIPRCIPMGYTLALTTDPQNSIDTILNLDIPEDFPTLSEQLLSDSSGLRGYSISLTQHSHYLPSGLELYSLQDEVRSRGLDLSKLLSDKIKSSNQNHWYDYIVIDCAPTLNDVTMAAVSVADYVIIPMLPVPMDIPGLCQTVDYVDGLSNAQGVRSKVAGILFCLDDGYNLSKEVKASVEAQYPGLPFHQSIRRSVKMEEATMGHTLLNPLSSNLAAQDYFNFTEEFLQRIK